MVQHKHVGRDHCHCTVPARTGQQSNWICSWHSSRGMAWRIGLLGWLYTSIGAHLGASVRPAPSPILYGLLGLIGIFMPGLLATAVVLPLWRVIRGNRIALLAVVLLTAWKTPPWLVVSTVAAASVLVASAL